MHLFNCPALHQTEVLIPRQGTDFSAWAVVACDQYTSQPDYWQQAEEIVRKQPSTLRLMLPEIFLEEHDAPQRIEMIRSNMADYLEQGILQSQGHGMVYVRRQTSTGLREGLVLAVDLDAYDFKPGTKALIRATEGTIIERIPPRMKIRRGAPLELPHIMVLFDDPKEKVMSVLRAASDTMPMLYDFDLMLSGGHISGQFVSDDALIASVDKALYSLIEGVQDPMLFAVGDGNHSLATAKACWEEIKSTLSDEEKNNHPARFCLVEAVNLHDQSLEFEPIHRVIFDVEAETLVTALEEAAESIGCKLLAREAASSSLPPQDGWQMVTSLGRVDVLTDKAFSPLPVGRLQALLDIALPKLSSARIDFIHGADTLRNLCIKHNAVGFLLPSMHKQDLFPAIMSGGVLPRKTFSMGEAQDKRYYLECRRIL